MINKYKLAWDYFLIGVISVILLGISDYLEPKDIQMSIMVFIAGGVLLVVAMIQILRLSAEQG